MHFSLCLKPVPKAINVLSLLSGFCIHKTFVSVAIYHSYVAGIHTISDKCKKKPAFGLLFSEEKERKNEMLLKIVMHITV